MLNNKQTLVSVLNTFYGPVNLRQAFNYNIVPNQPGTYCLLCEGNIMKVGKAENLKRRFGEYCRYKETYITPLNIDKVYVMWKILPRSNCRPFEKSLCYNLKSLGFRLPWTIRC